VLVDVKLVAEPPAKVIVTADDAGQPLPLKATVAPGSPLAGLTANVGVTLKVSV
jgi:hypothetical protein